MATYKAEAKLFITDPRTKAGRLVNAGQEFESNDPPGRYWKPLDDDGKKAVEARKARPLHAREASIAAERARLDLERHPERANAERNRPTPKLKGRRGAARTPGAARAKDRPPTPGKSVAQQQTDGEEPTRD